MIQKKLLQNFLTGGTKIQNKISRFLVFLLPYVSQYYQTTKGLLCSNKLSEKDVTFKYWSQIEK